MDILIVTETFDVLKDFISQLELEENLGQNYARFKYKEQSLDILISGYGGSMSVYAFTKAIDQNKYDLVLQFGQCYSLNNQIKKGQMVCIIDDYFGDIGIGMDNNFASVFDLEQRNKNEFPFKNQILENESLMPEVLADIRKASGITCNAIPNQINAIANSYVKNYPDVISREGANMLYICQKESLQLVQLFYVLDRIENVQNSIVPDESMVKSINEMIELIFSASEIAIS
jgi:nucleoside phosphorylase